MLHPRDDRVKRKIFDFQFFFIGINRALRIVTPDDAWFDMKKMGLAKIKFRFTSSSIRPRIYKDFRNDPAWRSAPRDRDE
jgi:hypothetical protein